jgi:glycosyltransferase involved in cell wall biosynthesis
MKILMYIPQPGPTRAPEVTANLAKLGNEVVAISPPEKQMLEIGVTIRPIRFTTLPLVGPFLLIGYGLVLAIQAIVCWKPDVIYTLGGSMGTGLLLARVFRIPLISEVNGWRRDELKLVSKHPFWMMLSKISCWMDEREIKHSNHVIVVITGIKEAIATYLKVNPDKISVIPNGANVDLFKPVRDAKKALRLDSDNHYVGFVGIIAPWQGLEHLIRSAPQILRGDPKTKFLLVGDGESKNKLVELVKELKLAAHFVFVGAVPYTEVPKYINAMDVCISFRKGTPASPLKLYEYMVCGKPVVATDNPDNNFAKEINAGILIDPEKPEEVAGAIISLLKNDMVREQMGENGRKYVLEKRSWQAVTQEVEGVIKSVINKKT